MTAQTEISFRPMAPATATIEDLLDKARALRGTLRAQQAEAEARTYPSREIYEAFLDAGFFRAMTPKVYGGYEMSLRDFYRLVMEIAKGCPSTAWWFCLGAHHAVNVSSYFPKSAQDRIFADTPDFSAPWSFNGVNLSWTKVEGGWRVSGTWMFSSGIPHSTWFMGGGPLPDDALPAGATAWEAPMISLIVPKGQYEMLNDWGSILGMKASGSHSGRLTDVFVPDDMVLIMDRSKPIDGKTPGGAAYGNPLYNGLMNGFVEGGLAAMAVGCAYAAIDAYVETITKRPVGKGGASAPSRASNVHYQRPLLQALTVADATRNMVLEGAETYRLFAQEAMTGKAPFSLERGMRMDGVYQLAEKMIWEMIADLCRNAGSGALRDGQMLQRYYRDITTLCTRTGQADHRTELTVGEYFRNRGIAV
ncbi:MAG: acyl-CoA dehydrogenase family protein [Rhodobacteraceae bacterium]|jgi:3-hydroxy-9,10-secoandrosta-1,3,5(10)-triene-9,17-dione monooxygenase|nr:acyl-CoA dehydrogenase family protein [Paracoccaceae bacterium]